MILHMLGVVWLGTFVCPGTHLCLETSYPKMLISGFNGRMYGLLDG